MYCLSSFKKHKVPESDRHVTQMVKISLNFAAPREARTPKAFTAPRAPQQYYSMPVTYTAAQLQPAPVTHAVSRKASWELQFENKASAKECDAACLADELQHPGATDAACLHARRD